MASKVRCKFCDEYIYKEDAVQVGFSSYCSMDHFYETKNKESRAASSRRRNKVGGQVPEQVREEVLERDGHACRWCFSKEGLHLHHIRYRSENISEPHVPLNLITLCGDCHALMHSDKGKYQPILLKKVHHGNR